MKTGERDDLLVRLDERTRMWYNISGGVLCYKLETLNQLER